MGASKLPFSKQENSADFTDMSFLFEVTSHTYASIQDLTLVYISVLCMRSYCGLTPAGNRAPQSCLLASLQWDEGAELVE